MRMLLVTVGFFPGDASGLAVRVVILGALQPVLKDGRGRRIMELLQTHLAHTNCENGSKKTKDDWQTEFPPLQTAKKKNQQMGHFV